MIPQFVKNLYNKTKDSLSKITLMPKRSQIFKIDNYKILFKQKNQYLFSIQVIDLGHLLQFSQQKVTLTNIKADVVKQALSQQSKYAIILFKPIYQKQNSLSQSQKQEYTQKKQQVLPYQYLQMKIILKLQFLKPIQQIIKIPIIRKVPQQQLIKKQIYDINNRIEKITNNGQKSSLQEFKVALKQKSMNLSNSNYEEIISIHLLRGRYIVTFTALINAQNQYVYFYLNKGRVILNQSGGFYIPNRNMWLPVTLRFCHQVKSYSETLTFDTYYTASYPIKCKNLIITAKKVDISNQYMPQA